MFCLVDIAKYVMFDDTVVYMCVANYEILLIYSLKYNKESVATVEAGRALGGALETMSSIRRLM